MTAVPERCRKHQAGPFVVAVEKWRVKLERYWRLDFHFKISIGEEEAGERVVDLLPRCGARARCRKFRWAHFFPAA